MESYDRYSPRNRPPRRRLRLDSELPEDNALLPVTPPLTRDEIEYAFRRATAGFSGGKERWVERVAIGLTDEELAEH